MRSLIFTFALSVILLGCSSPEVAPSKAELGRRELYVMSYNVENLFDVTHDEGKNDWTFLPRDYPGKSAECEKVKSSYRRRECFETDWSAQKLELKISQIKKVIMSSRALLPDLLALTEVENEKVVGMLAQALGYSKYIVSNGPDERGIDVALLWRERVLKMTASREHQLRHPLFENKPTRPILEVSFELDGKPLYVFVNHWPSLGNPDETKIIAAKLLKGRMTKVLSESSHASAIALGDFNTIDRLNPHPFKDVLTKEAALVDLEASFRAGLSYHERGNIPPGSYFYAKEMQWNQLDRVFVSKNLMTGEQGAPKVDVQSFKIVAPEFLTRPTRYQDDRDYLFGSVITGTPWAYDHNASSAAEAGYSDHFALEFMINF